MNKYVRILTASFAVIAVSGCGRQETSGETPTGSSGNLSQPPPAVASADSVGEGNDVAPARSLENGSPAASTAHEADAPGKAGTTVFDAGNSSFTLDGANIRLRNGVSREAAAPGSASSVTTRYLGMAARGDLTGDGRDDTAYFVARDGAGSGRFYYVVAAISLEGGYRTTNAFLVGDRIDPQSLRITAKELHVAFKGRRAGEPMTSPPSRESVLLLKVTPQGRLEGLMR